MTPDNPRDAAELPRTRCTVNHAELIADMRTLGYPEDFLAGLAASYAAEHAAGVVADLEALLDVAATWGGEGE